MALGTAGPGASLPGASHPGTTGTLLDAGQLDVAWGGDVVVHDAHLLFQGEYSRVGFDLVIRDESSRLTVHDYFRPGRRPNLVSEEGASLSGDVVEALALSSHGQRYAQAGTPPAAPTIGRVETVGGTASVLRNGAAVALNVGDPVYRGDVVQTGGGSSLGITFIDGTAFSLSSGARMVLNDMVYAPGGTGNSALISLVQGSISFVAGQVAKTGDMRVDTPVATMGIRGTAVNVDISADNGTTRFSVMREPDGRVGSYVLYSKTDPSSVLATVSQADVGVVIAANGSVTSFTKSPGDLGTEQLIVQLVFQLFNAGQANPIVVTPAPAPPAPSPGGPQGGGGGGSSTPPDGATGGSPGPASPQLPPPVTPAQPDGAAPGPTGPGAPPPAAQSPSGGGGTTQQTSNTTGGVSTGVDVAATGTPTNAAATAGQPATDAPTTAPAQTSPAQPGSAQPSPAQTSPAQTSPAQPDPAQPSPAQPSPAQGTPPAPFTPKTVTVAANDLVLASGSRDGVLARDGASDASIATEHVVSAQGAAGPEVAVASGPTTVTGTYGTLAIQADGSYSYLALRASVLAKGEAGDDVFTFTVQEPDGSLAASTLTFRVAGVNDAPVATPDRVAANIPAGSGVDANVRSAGVLANDTDPDRGETGALAVSAVAPQGAPGTAVAPGAPATVAGRYGELTIAGDGTYHYVADHAQALAKGVVGEDVFTYTITDPNGATSSASLTFGVTGVNDAPVAQDRTATIGEDGSATITPAASDADGDALTYGIVTGPRHGSVTFESGAFRYVPDADYDGPDSFTYRANDGAADSNVATVSLTVTPVNDAPVIDLDTAAAGTGTSVAYSGPVLIAPGPVSITDPDAGATIDHVTLTLAGSGGPDTIDTLSLDAGASAAYAIDPGSSGGVYVLHRRDGQPGTASDYADALSHVVFTSGDDTADRTVTIAVTPNDGTADGTAAVSTVNVPALPGGTNQAPQMTPSGTTTAYAFGGTPVVVDPAITVTDADSPTLDHATIRVSLDDFSLVTGDFLRITAGSGFTVDPATDDLVGFADGGVIHQSFVDGVLTLTGEGASPADFQAAFEAVAFSTTNETESRDRRVSFTANDGISESYAVSDHVAVRFTPNDIFTTPRDTPLTADVPAGAGTIYTFGTPGHGTVAAADPDDPRAFTYTPAAGYSGPDSFAYTVDDGAGGTTIGHITIGVDPNEGGRFGYAVASLGDLDGDGLADTAAGAPGNYGNAGIVFISRNNGGDHQYQVQGSTGEQLGSALAGLGDLSGDGTPDLVAGAPGANGGAGAAYVVFGRAAAGDTTTIMTSSLDGSPAAEGFAITGARGGNHAGSSVAAAGYVNGDAIPDILVGAPDAAEGGGTAYLVYGKAGTGTVSLAAIEDGNTTNGIVIYGADGDHLGFSVAGGGDIDRDGFADFLLGAPGDPTTPGSVYVIRGAAELGNIDVADSATFTGFHIVGAAEGDQFGYAVANVGDVNGDGYDDFAIGAPHSTAGDHAEAGKVYVIYGARDLSGIDVSNLGTRGFTISGAAAGDHLGTSVAFAGDVNGDGLADIIVGAPDSTNGGRPGDGSAYIVLGSGTGQNVDVGLLQSVNLAGFTPEDHLGSSVSTTGDSSGSGLAGFASGAPRSYDVNSNSVNSGYYGSTAYSPPAFTASGDASNNTLTGTAGNDIIGGQQGDDRISGLGGADVLNGGQGHDVFVFTPDDAADANGRPSVITDFHPFSTTLAQGERDQIDATGFGVAIATLIDNAMQVNSHDTLIMLDESHSVLLKNVLKASLSADDFADLRV